MKSIFFGSSSYVIPIINVLKRNFELSLVVTTEKQGSVSNYCKINSISCISISSFDKTINNKLKTTNAPVGILADFRLIIPNDIMKLFPKGVLNVHPSLLPKYRGPTPVQTAILNGGKITGTTLMKLDSKIDHGPIIAQTKEPILENDTAETLYKKLFDVGAKLLEENLQKYVDDKIKPVEQNDAKASMTKKLTRQNGYVDLSKIKSKEEFERKVRAYFPWPGVWTRSSLRSSGQAKFKIMKFLPGQKIQVEGKKSMGYKDFINGYPNGKEILTLLKILA